jgi:hypothetical protein
MRPGPRIREWECLPLDVRDIVINTVAERRFKHGRLAFDWDGSALRMRGEAHGAPVEAVVLVARLPGKFNRWRALCPCGNRTWRLLVTPHATLGCVRCLNLYPSYAWWPCCPYRRSKTAVLAGLESPDAHVRKWALWALELGPIRRGRPRARPTKKQRIHDDPWDEEVMELRLLLTGRWPWE